MKKVVFNVIINRKSQKFEDYLLIFHYLRLKKLKA